MARTAAASFPVLLLIAATALLELAPALAVPPARSAPQVGHAADASAPAREPATIDGTVSVSIQSSTLKHWGVPAAEAAFVPDSDASGVARAIREASGTAALCAAIERAGVDTVIATAPVDGDGNFEHRSGDETRLAFRLVVRASAPATAGRLYICSRPVVAIVSRGNYPDERFLPADGHRLSWSGRRIALRPGEHAQVHLTASIDASQW